MISRLYTAAFDRVPDQDGLNYWISQWENFMPLDEIAARFYDADEFKVTYGMPSDGEYIDILYNNVFDRPGDTGGVEYWVGRLGDGTQRYRVLAEFADSNENRINTDELFTIAMGPETGQWLIG